MHLLLLLLLRHKNAGERGTYLVRHESWPVVLFGWGLVIKKGGRGAHRRHPLPVLLFLAVGLPIVIIVVVGGGRGGGGRSRGDGGGGGGCWVVVVEVEGGGWWLWLITAMRHCAIAFVGVGNFA